MKLLTLKQTKLNKSEKYGWRTIGLALSPAIEYSSKTTCAMSGLCALTCLAKTGHNVYPTHIKARMARTKMYWEDRQSFLNQLAQEVAKQVDKAEREGQYLAMRPNLLSDRRDLGLFIKTQFPDLRVYDYTKIIPRDYDPEHYHLTYSVSERTTRDDIHTIRKLGINPAVIFPVKKGQDLPNTITLAGVKYPVIDGDKHDLRFLDPKNVVVGLRWKGAMAKVQEGMVYGGLDI